MSAAKLQRINTVLQEKKKKTKQKAAHFYHRIISLQASSEAAGKLGDGHNQLGASEAKTQTSAVAVETEGEIITWRNHKHKMEFCTPAPSFPAQEEVFYCYV